MIEPVVIGPAVAADAEAIAAMDRECLQDGWEATTVGTLLGESSAICRVARSHSGIAGFVLCRLAADECEVLSCAVDTGFRRRGDGAPSSPGGVRRGGQPGRTESLPGSGGG